MKKPQNKKIVLAGVVLDYFYWYNGTTMLIWLGYGAPKNYIYMYIYILLSTYNWNGAYKPKMFALPFASES